MFFLPKLLLFSLIFLLFGGRPSVNDIFYEALKDSNKNVYAQLQLDARCKLHFHRAYEFAYALSGQTFYSVEGDEFTVESDNIVYIHKFYRHISRNLTPNQRYVIAVPDNFSYDLSSFLEKSPPPSLMRDKEFNRTLRPYFEQILNTSPDTPDLLTNGLLNVIIGHLNAHYGTVNVKKEDKNVSLIVEILCYIDKHAADGLTLDGVAQHFGYNSSYFSRLFSKCVGMPFNEYVNLAKLNLFDKLSKSKDHKSITELIYASGFQSTATFYRVYEKRRLARGY